MDVTFDMAVQLHNYAAQNATRLSLDPERPIEVHGFHSVFRVAPDGRLLIELVVQFAQKETNYAGDFGGIPVRGGTTLIASADGTVRYAITKPLPSSSQADMVKQRADERVKRQLEYVQLCDSRDASGAYCSERDFSKRMRARTNLAALHQGIS